MTGQGQLRMIMGTSLKPTLYFHVSRLPRLAPHARLGPPTSQLRAFGRASSTGLSQVRALPGPPQDDKSPEANSRFIVCNADTLQVGNGISLGVTQRCIRSVRVSCTGPIHNPSTTLRGRRSNSRGRNELLWSLSYKVLLHDGVLTSSWRDAAIRFSDYD